MRNIFFSSVHIPIIYMHVHKWYIKKISVQYRLLSLCLCTIYALTYFSFIYMYKINPLLTRYKSSFHVCTRFIVYYYIQYIYIYIIYKIYIVYTSYKTYIYTRICTASSGHINSKLHANITNRAQALNFGRKQDGAVVRLWVNIL